MKLIPYSIKKGFKYLKHYGLKEFWIKLMERMEPEAVPYGEWRKKHIPTKQELEQQCREQQKWSKRPLVSVVIAAGHTQEQLRRQMIESVEKQTYTGWQLCVAENMNAALDMAEGEWVGFLDSTDLLAENALYEVVKVINTDETIDVVYTDEDKVNVELTDYVQPQLKPDFSIDLLRSNNYISHFFVVRRSLLQQVGGFQKDYDGAQDYDLIFRCTETARRVYHVPEILYHSRIYEETTPDNSKDKQYIYDAGQRAIEAHLKRQGVHGVVDRRKDMDFYEVKYPVQGEPLVSIIIPNKDQVEILNTCLTSVGQSTYSNVEIIIVENNSEQEETFAFYKQIEEGKCYTKFPVRIVTWEKGFNYSAINNFGFAHAKGEYIILLNNDIEIINHEWIEEMLGNCQRPEVGIVGAKLYYPDDSIQHAGIALGIGEGRANGGVAGAMLVGMERSCPGYLNRALMQLNYSAVTAACLMVKRSIYEEVGGLEEDLAVAYNDVDFCLKVGQAGYLIVYNPRVEAYHHESKSRGQEDTPEKVERFQRETEYMKEKWGSLLKNDPYYNKHFSRSRVNYSLIGR